MKKHIIWKGIEYHSMENCVITSYDNGSVIDSTIIGFYKNTPYQVSYQVHTNQHWQTIYFEIKSQINESSEIITYQSDGKGNWFSKGQSIDAIKGCVDIDISVTPFTKTLPIRRLNLAHKQIQEIQVFYIDILARQTGITKQYYTKLTDNSYKFETSSPDFESILTVDKWGLITDYPELFSREFLSESNY